MRKRITLLPTTVLLMVLPAAASAETAPAAAVGAAVLAEARQTGFGALVRNNPIPVLALMLVFCVLAVVAVLYVSGTRQRRLEQKKNEELAAALMLAQQASEAKGSFMSRMSHEVRTPLNAVIGYNMLARNELLEAKTDAERRQAGMKVMDCLTKSDIASRHLLTIINDVLDMSAIESGHVQVVKERFDFKGLISQLTTVFYTQAKAKRVEFEVHLDTLTEEWLIGDQMRVNQVLTNLLSNAVKFTPEGGSVLLTIHCDMKESTVLVHFEVRDTGIGMTEEYMDRIWLPFEQADSSISRRFGGTGLGLSITKTLVGLLGGTITVDSKPGEGSVFRVELTFDRADQPDAGVYDFSNINALIVDDDASTCDYVRLLLTRCGARSASVTSGRDAIDAVTAAIEAGEPYTVCLVDWRMPGMDGIETVGFIRKVAGENLPIIVITAYDYSEIADKTAAVGIQRFLSKPLFQSSMFDLLVGISGAPAAMETQHRPVHDFAGARVLLAEDNMMNMEIARKILQSAGLAVDGAWNGQDAVTMFENAPTGTYRAILMDVQMPVMDGYRATRVIRASAHPEAASIPIIAMTADAFAENVAEAMGAGMNAHISKPIDLKTLFDTLLRYIG